MADIGTMLQAVSAGLSGNLPQFNMQQDQRRMIAQQEQEAQQQKQQMLSKERYAAMVQDAYQLQKLIGGGKMGAAVKLLDNRIESINKLGGDPFDSLRVKDLLVSGDPAKFEQLQKGLQETVDAGAIFWQPPEAAQMSPAEAEKAKLARDKFEWEKNNPDARGDSEGVQSSQILDDGTVVQVLKSGKTRVVDPTGSELSGQARADAIRSAQEYGVDIQSGRAGGRTTAAGTAKRVDEFINQGVTAAQSIPVMKRAVSLLDQIETGGIDKASIEAKKLFGIESADEGEVSFLLAKNVLSQLKETFGGAFTVEEVKRLTDIEAGLGRSTASNKRIIAQAMKIAERKAERGIKAAEKAGDDFTAQDIADYLKSDLTPQDFGATNGITEETAAQRLARLKGGN
jgi:hypothetical protein